MWCEYSTRKCMCRYKARNYTGSKVKVQVRRRATSGSAPVIAAPYRYGMVRRSSSLLVTPLTPHYWSHWCIGLA